MIDVLNLCFARLPPSDPRLQLVAAKFERNVKNVRSLPSALAPKLLPPYHKIYDVIRLIFFKAPEPTGLTSHSMPTGCSEDNLSSSKTGTVVERGVQEYEKSEEAASQACRRRRV